MPQFSARLKQNLTFECLDTEVDDLIEPHTKDLYDADMRMAKRRRIEKIATLCLQGQHPVIITAGLKGPFDKSWRNPWITKPLGVDSASSTVLSQIPSPETARGLNPDARQEPLEVSKPWSHEHDIPVTYDVSDNNPFWLSRSEIHEKGFESSSNRNCELSPLRLRNGIRPLERDGRIQVAPPKCMIGPTTKLTTIPRCEVSHTSTTTPKCAVNQEASIITPSTIEKLQRDQGETSPTSDRQRSMEPTPIVPATHAKKALPLSSTFTPINNTAGCKIAPDTITSNTVQVDKASPNTDNSHYEGADLALAAIAGAGSHSPPPRRLSRHDLQQSAERCSQPQPKRKQSTSNAPGDELIASPALGSATGFRYKRAGDSRVKTSGWQKPRARKKSTSRPPIARHEASRPVEVVAGPNDGHDMSTGTLDGDQSPKTSEHSMFSTQAAMMLAHLEFQESSGFPRASLPSPVETPPKTHKANIACTPFSTFNAELDKRHPPMQDLQDVLLSTQDLLAAASPFAFSTTKKNDVQLTRSNLKFSVFPSREEGATMSVASVSRSPTPSNRIPLQEKNARVVFGNNEREKSLQESMPCMKVKLKAGHLNLGRSLRDFGHSNSQVDDLNDGYLSNYEAG